MSRLGAPKPEPPPRPSDWVSFPLRKAAFAPGTPRHLRCPSFSLGLVGGGVVGEPGSHLEGESYVRYRGRPEAERAGTPSPERARTPHSFSRGTLASPVLAPCPQWSDPRKRGWWGRAPPAGKLRKRAPASWGELPAGQQLRAVGLTRGKTTSCCWLPTSCPRGHFLQPGHRHPWALHRPLMAIHMEDTGPSRTHPGPQLLLWASPGQSLIPHPSPLCPDPQSPEIPLPST